MKKTETENTGAEHITENSAACGENVKTADCGAENTVLSAGTYGDKCSDKTDIADGAGDGYVEHRDTDGEKRSDKASDGKSGAAYDAENKNGGKAKKRSGKNGAADGGKKRTVRKKRGVPTDSETCLSEASDIMCRATYRAIKNACDTDDGGEACAKSLKEYWSVLKEALSVTDGIKSDGDGENVVRVIMDDAAERYAE